MGFWGIGVLVHFLEAFVFEGGTGWEKRQIQKEVERLKKEQEETEKKYKHALDRLQKLQEELEEIRKAAQEEGQKKKEYILQTAEKEAEKIKDFTRQEIEMFTKTKVRELKAHTAELATELAESNIKAKMTPERQSLLIDLSIDKLEDFYGK